jgi:hypothetical protein
MLLGLNLKIPNLRSMGGYVPVPGAPFIVRSSTGAQYTIGLPARDSSGVDYTVASSAKTSDGTEYYPI